MDARREPDRPLVFLGFPVHTQGIVIVGSNYGAMAREALG